MADDFGNFIGQTNVKKQLTLAIHSALRRGDRLPHILLVAPPGVGKTSLAAIIAELMYQDFESFFMPISDRILEGLMSEFEGIVLLDELHRAPARQQELLLNVLHDGYLQTKSGLRIENQNITFIGATTEGDKLVDAVRERFPLRPLFDPYTDEEMAEIILIMAETEHATIPRKSAFKLAKAALGVPRNARNIVYTWRDLELQQKHVEPLQVLAAMRLTDTGLSAEHIRYCEFLAKAGGKAGVDLLKQLLSMPTGAVERLEVDLIKQNIIIRQSNGRELTSRGFELAGITRFGRKQNNGRRP